MIIQLKNIHTGKGRAAGRVGQTFCRQSRVGSGRVQEKWPVDLLRNEFHRNILCDKFLLN